MSKNFEDLQKYSSNQNFGETVKPENTSTNLGDPFWTDDYKVLFDKDNISSFFPTMDMTLIEKLNSIMRMSIYLSLALYIFTSNYLYLYIMIIVGALTYFTYTYQYDNINLYLNSVTNSNYNLVQKNIIETKGDKHPVGSFLGEELKPFTNHELDLKTGDQLYLFTDGFADQFGGPLGKKFKYQSFKKLLISVSDLSMKKQKEEILKTFKKWKGHLEQVDDVCVFSVKI